RHHPAGDLLGERETGAARQRLDVEHHVAELAVAARLLLVPAALHDRLADGLAISDLRRAALDRDAETIGKTLGRDAQMHLALAGRRGPALLARLPDQCEYAGHASGFGLRRVERGAVADLA